MTPGYIPQSVREQVRVDARNRCGYCLAPQALAYDALELDHIVPEAAGGANDRNNLWLSCRSCNRHKGAQTHGQDPATGQRERLFNPRSQSWERHFAWSDDGCEAIGLTACGRATIRALHINNPFAVQTRRLWVEAGWHPPAS